MYVKNCIFVFARLKVVKVSRCVSLLLNKLGNNGFDPRVETCLLAEEGKELRHGAMCAIDGPTSFAEQWVVWVVEGFVAPGSGAGVLDCVEFGLVRCALGMCASCVGMMLAFGSSRTYRQT